MSGKMLCAAVVAVSSLAMLGPSARADGPTGGGAAPSWTGLYLGLQAGGGWSEADWTGPQDLFGVDTFTSKPDGWLFGGHVGYNFQTGPWVFGAEISYSGSTLRDTVVGPAVFLPEDTFKTDIEDLFTATARIGYASNNWLLYARGGYANAEVALSGTGAAFVFDVSKRIDGWTAGTGLEYKLTRNVVLGLEYNFVSLSGSFTATPSVAGIPLPDNPLAIDLDQDIHTVKGRLSILLQ